MLENILNRLGGLFREAWQLRNVFRAALLVILIALVIIAFLLAEDAITDVAKYAGSLMADLIKLATQSPSSLIVTALVLFVIAVVIIGAMLIQDARRHPTVEAPPPECDRHHTTEDEQSLLDWAGTERNYDIQNVNGRLETQVTANVNTLLSLTDPRILIHFDVRNSALHHIVIGREVKGHVTAPPHRLGDTPKPRLNDKLENVTLALDRGERGCFTLEQPVTADLRNMWIKNRLEQKVQLDLEGLAVSVDLSNLSRVGFAHRDNLRFGHSVTVRLDKDQDWPWQEEPWRTYAAEQAELRD